MGKLVADDVLDNGLNILVNSGSHMNVNKAAPASFAEAVSTHILAWTGRFYMPLLARHRS